MAEDETSPAGSAQQALVDEALKKGALVWLELDEPVGGASRGGAGRGHARWYAWTEGHLYLLTGREEQPDPGLVVGGAVRILVRSKDNKHLLVTLDADVSLLQPSDPDWAAATAELAKKRLNLADSEDAARRWTEPGYTVYRLVPRLPLVEQSAEGLAASRRAAPPPTTATTSGRKPWVLHRRGGHGRRLS